MAGYKNSSKELPRGPRWNVYFSNRFKAGYKNSSKELQCRIDKAIEQLAIEDDPYSLGEPKQGPWRGYSSYDFGRTCRLIYAVEPQASRIVCERVCSHKEYDR